MIEQGRESLELRRTSELVRTVIDLLRVRWTRQVLVQIPLGCELAVAEVAFIFVPVPGILGRPAPFVPFEQVLGYHAIGTAPTKFSEDALTVNTLGVGARSSLQVMQDSARGGEATLAEGTGDLSPLMMERVQVLPVATCQQKFQFLNSTWLLDPLTIWRLLALSKWRSQSSQ